jgi:AraC-like DNA-binding protein
MTKATGLGRLPELLEQHASVKSVSKAYEKAGLPLEIIEFPDTRIPFQAMRDLFEIAARAAGDRCFGLSVGMDMTHTGFGLWMKYCAQAPTLADGLARSANCTTFQQSGGKVVVVPTAPVSFWRYIAPGGAATRPIQHCDHLIGPMLRFVQSFLGVDWRPEWVEVDYPRDRLSHQLEAQLPYPIRYGAPGMGLAIRHSDLSRRSKASPKARQTITFADVHAYEATGPSKEPLKSVFDAITLRLLDGQTDIEGAASGMRVGVQNLQRALRREGVDYRDLVNRAKRNRAMALLTDTDLPVIDIAFSLGYSDHANFSRAFKRMMGVAPTTFRAAQLCAR